MRRTPPTIHFLAATDAAFSTATMSSRPYHRGHRRGYSSRSNSGGRGHFVTGDDHLQSVRDANLALRRGESENFPNQTQFHQNPPYDLSRHPPPAFYFQNPPYNPRPHAPPQYHNPSYTPRPHPRPPPQYQNPSYTPRPHPYPHSHRPPHFRQPNDHQRQYRPQQNIRPKAPDHREWEVALTPPPPPPHHSERFKVLSYNILADYLAMDHWRKLYYHIPSYMLNWQWRKSKIIFELGLWSADIMCFQEVDRFDELAEDLKFKGYRGIWKMRTGNPVDGCAIFWRTSRFNLLYEESIEFNRFGLRDNVAQICVLEFINQNGSLPPSLTGSRKVVVCNTHVLYNPNRGEIKLGQVRILLDKARAVSQLWNNSPVIICGDFNCTPKSPLYNFIAEQKLDLSGIDRDKLSGQASAVIRSPWRYGPKSSEKRFDNGSVQVTSAEPEGDKEITIEQNSSLSDMQNPDNESNSLENQNTRPVLDMSDKTNMQCSRESDASAGKDTQEAGDHNKIVGEVDDMKEVPNPSYNNDRLPNDDEIHDVTPITSSALETVHTGPTGMGGTEHVSDAISTSYQESFIENSNLHDHKGNKHVEPDCSPNSIQEGDQTSKVKIDLESTDLLNLEVFSNKPSSMTSVSEAFEAPHSGYRESSSYEVIANDQTNCSSTAYLVDEPQKPTNIDFTLNEKLEKFSFDEIDKADVSSGNTGEDASDFINALHNAEEESNEVEDCLSPSLFSKSIDAEKSTYNPSLWTPVEIEIATGNAECTFLEHPLSLKSTYAEAVDSSGTRDPNGEPLVTSYNKCFLGTVDYIWRSEGLQTTRVLAPIPKRVMESTQGYPTKKWGSDHIALVSELAFLEDGAAISKDVV